MFEASGILSGTAVETPFAIGGILLSVRLRTTFIFNLPLRKALPKYHLIEKAGNVHSLSTSINIDQ